MTARAHHFQMKYLLAQLALQNPQRFLVRFRPDGDQRFLADLWSAVGRDLDPAERIPSHGVAVWHRAAQDDEGEMVVLTFPTPAGTGEAYFVAALVQHHRGRVFCLERTVHPMTQEAGTMLVELAANSRANFGAVVVSGLEDFVAMIDHIVQDGLASPHTLTPLPTSLSAPTSAA
jgi:hypothetical protein